MSGGNLSGISLLYHGCYRSNHGIKQSYILGFAGTAKLLQIKNKCSHNQYICHSFLFKFIMHVTLQTCFTQVSLGAITYMVDILIDKVWDYYFSVTYKYWCTDLHMTMMALFPVLICTFCTRLAI